MDDENIKEMILEYLSKKYNVTELNFEIENEMHELFDLLKTCFLSSTNTSETTY